MLSIHFNSHNNERLRLEIKKTERDRIRSIGKYISEMNFIKRIPLSIRPIEDMAIWIKIQRVVNSQTCIAVYYIGMEKRLQWVYGNCFWRKHGQLQAPNKIIFHMEGDQRYPKAPNKIK